MKKTILVVLIGLFISEVFGQQNSNQIKFSNEKINALSGEEIFNNLLLAFSFNADSVIRLFNKDAIIEFPYASSLGTAERLNNQEYYNYLKGGLPNMPNIKFQNIKVYPTINNAYWAEAHGEVKIPRTGKLYKQKYVMYFILKEGKISLYREYWDSIAGQKAFGHEQSLEEIFNKN